MKNVNIIAQRRAERYQQLDETTKQKLDSFFDKESQNHQLQFIKSSKVKPRVGDIFVLSPRKGMYFYGKVMVADIERITPDSFVDGKSVVLIFESHANEISMENYQATYDSLLIPPAIVDSDYWEEGFFFTIGNLPLPDMEKELDIGFYKLHFKKNFYCKVSGEVLDHEPKYLGIHGLTTITGIASEIERELIIREKEFDL